MFARLAAQVRNLGAVLSRRLMLGGSAALAVGATARPALAKGVGVDAPGAAVAREVVRGMMAQTHAPAMSAAVCRDGELVWAEAFGLADLETKAPVSLTGRFRLASVSKLFAGAVAARLAERGAVNLDRPIGNYRPSLPEPHRRTTLRQLLGHTAGVRHYIPRDYDPKAPGGAIDFRPYRNTEEALAVFIHDPLVSKPGEAFNYSTFGYVLAGAVLESATGKRFPQLVTEEVIRPLDLPTLMPESMTSVIPQRVSCYQPLKDGGLFKAPAINPAYKWAGGGYVGAASDVARFCTAFTTPGYLDEENLERMFTPLAPGPVGIGWWLDRDPEGRLRGYHAGSIAGGRSIALLLPEAGVSVVVLSNLSDLPVDPLTPAQRIAEAFLV
ncbi:hypothetical protein CSW64_08480 [Caulobacter mirabilis]|uniref:Beta-lactamase-related domain-containing protein n=2 Tax=Caulobacter mirabilis TaxID=69666 RepID=A0A2D2AWR3_9CAUL|nr:hypothetical protein CSW64_08480 [Caulobacter mirabilis]